MEGLFHGIELVSGRTGDAGGLDTGIALFASSAPQGTQATAAAMAAAAGPGPEGTIERGRAAAFRQPVSDLAGFP